MRVRRDEKGYFQPGTKPGPGRPKGVPNKVTQDIKNSLMEALQSDDGATAYFKRLKIRDHKTFCGMIGKLIPHELAVGGTADGVPLVIVKDYTGGTSPDGGDES